MSPVRSAGGSEASVSGDSLHQSMVPRGAVGFQVRVEWALEVGCVPADLIDVWQRASIVRALCSSQSHLLSLNPGGGDVHHDLLEGGGLLGLALSV